VSDDLDILRDFISDEFKRRSKVGSPSYFQKTNRALDALKRVADEMARLKKLVFVPGLRKCAKCNFSLMTTELRASDGSMRADNSPQECANGCGPMWPVTERDAGNELLDRIDTMMDEHHAIDRINAAEIKRLNLDLAAYGSDRERLRSRLAELEAREGKLREALVEKCAHAIWEAQRSRLTPDGLNARLTWRSSSAPAKFWDSYVRDAAAALDETEKPT
jgi:hypothetical protein